MVIPLAAVLVLGTVRLIEVRGTASDSSRVADLTRIGTDISNITRLVQVERMAAAAFLASRGKDESGYADRIKEVDAQIQTFREHRADLPDLPDRVMDKFSVIDEQLATLTDTRNQVNGRKDITVFGAIQQYGDVLNGLAGFEDAVSQIADPGSAADALRSLGAFSRIENSVAQQEAIAYSVRVSGEFTQVRDQQLTAAKASRDSAYTDFRTLASTNQIGMVEAILADAKMTTADGLNTRLTGNLKASLDDIVKAYEDVLDLLRTTERTLEDQTVAIAEDAAASASRRATIEFAVVLLALLTTIAFAVALAANLNLAARRLRHGALTVANRDLPEAVHRLQDIDSLGDRGVERILAETRDPIRLTGKDEFGQVAEAFNMVHREAIRVAAEQAALRTSVSAMFLSLARRSQALVDRMIGELDGIERTEEDPKRLAKLFDLDHLATRMRRNDENLLVLAGAEVGTPRREDAPLIDVLRAAQSEVEQYNRIEFGSIDTDVLVMAGAVNDTVRLIAELFDNATHFSPPTTQVMASGRQIGHHAVVQIEDRGLGISADQLEMINRRLAEPTEVDVATFRLMGFAVIARLASRHGIRVRVLPGREGGTIAEVTLPSDIVMVPGVPAVPQRSAGWNRSPATPQLSAGSDYRPPIRAVASQSPALPRMQQLPAAEDDLDLRPTPDRPKLPTRVPASATAGPEAPPARYGAQPEPPAPAPAAVPAAQPAWHTPSYEQPGYGRPAYTEPAYTQPAYEQPAAPSWQSQSAAQPAYQQPVARTAYSPPAAQPAYAQPAAQPAYAAQPAGYAQPAQSNGWSAPIQVEMQQSWFEVTASSTRPEGGMPTAGYAPPPTPMQPISAPPSAHHPAPATSTPPAATVPRPRVSPEDRWRTAADEGWARAMAAAAPRDAGNTMSGLPKRVPQAQLVPGGVQPAPRAQNRRSADEVRGLLSAYTRGVQRGRTDGVAESGAAAFQATKENNK
ncbi:nitrate- and nitrite sensing domain-containing protein [Actinoplanes sp. NPDC051851]|uniref:sensor histidine kinase n=1 Tax=Actinoplanes sp. NPDC051851 TaxID=3154753 RepID=UPI00343D76A1